MPDKKSSIGRYQVKGKLGEIKPTASIVAKGEVMIWGVTPGLLEQLSCSSQLGFQNAFIEMIVQRLTKGTRDIARLQELLYKAKHKKKEKE
jgi:hypothetical protein